MLSMRVEFSDLHAPLEILTKGIVKFGNSYVSILNHRMLEHFIFWNDRRIIIINREIDTSRYAIEKHEVSNKIDSDEVIENILKDFVEWDLASIIVDIKRNSLNPIIKIRTNHNPQSSLFLTGNTSFFQASWSFLELVKISNFNQVDLQNLSRWLMSRHQAYGTATLFTNILNLPIDSDANILKHHIQITSRDVRSIYAPRQLRDGLNLREIFFNTFADCIDRHPVKDGHVACELSGGLDSSVAALISSAVVPHLVAASLFDSTVAQGSNQMFRQSIVARSLRLPHVTIDVNNFLPFTPHSERRRELAVSYFVEPFHEAFVGLTEKLKDLHIDTVITGQGGDEAFPIYADEYLWSGTIEGFSVPNPKPSFVTAKAFALSEFSQVVGSSHFSYHGSASQAPDYRNERMYARGIWPINPYLEPKIIQLTSSLPFDEKFNRKFLQKILISNGLQEFERFIPDAFDSAISKQFRDIEGYFLNICDNSYSAKHDLVDVALVKAEYYKARDAIMSEDAKRISHHIIFFVQIETFLQQCVQAGLLK